jgi:hypothetical protein
MGWPKVNWCHARKEQCEACGEIWCDNLHPSFHHANRSSHQAPPEPAATPPAPPMPAAQSEADKEEAYFEESIEMLGLPSERTAAKKSPRAGQESKKAVAVTPKDPTKNDTFEIVPLRARGGRCCFYELNGCGACEHPAPSDSYCAQSQHNCVEDCKHTWCGGDSMAVALGGSGSDHADHEDQDDFIVIRRAEATAVIASLLILGACVALALKRNPCVVAAVALGFAAGKVVQSASAAAALLKRGGNACVATARRACGALVSLCNLLGAKTRRSYAEAAGAQSSEILSAVDKL